MSDDGYFLLYFFGFLQFMIQVGGSITFLLGPVLTWRMLALVGTYIIFHSFASYPICLSNTE